MKRLACRWFLACAVLCAAPALAEEEAPRAVLPLTVLDAPEAFVLPSHVPTWEQSLNLTGALFEATHLGLHYAFTHLSRAWWSVLLEQVAVSTFDVLMALAPVPLAEGWAHEEGHRATMGVMGVPSRQVFNNLFYAPADRCDPGSVCGMTDDQIAIVKERRAADWVRVQAAGMETELELMRRLERSAFFADEPRWLNLSASWILLASVELYRHVCTDPSVFGPDAVSAESPHMLQRDFTGPDCTGLVYDLFRPGEPYADRGLHPNGDGVRRVRLLSDLTADERSYLVRMRNLGFLNFVDPALVGFPRFEVTLASGRRVAFAASLQHDLTAFGDAFGLSLRAKVDALQVVAVARLYRNQALALPGLSAGVVRFPLHVGSATLLGSATVEAWLQPAELSFTTTSVAPGGALELQVAFAVAAPLEVFAAVRGKSGGWRPADAWLDPAFSGRLGVNLLLPGR